MVWYGVATENLCSVMEVIHFIEVGQLLSGKEFTFKCKEQCLGFLCDLVGEVKVPGTGQALLWTELRLTVEKLDFLLFEHFFYFL